MTIWWVFPLNWIIGLQPLTFSHSFINLREDDSVFGKNRRGAHESNLTWSEQFSVFCLIWCDSLGVNTLPMIIWSNSKTHLSPACRLLQRDLPLYIVQMLGSIMKPSLTNIKRNEPDTKVWNSWDLKQSRFKPILHTAAL